MTGIDYFQAVRTDPQAGVRTGYSHDQPCPCARAAAADPIRNRTLWNNPRERGHARRSDDGAERLQATADDAHHRIPAARERSRSDLHRSIHPCVSAGARFVAPHRGGDTQGSIRRPGYDHGIGDLDTAIIAQHPVRQASISPLSERRAAFIFGDPAYLLAPSIFMLEIGYAASPGRPASTRRGRVDARPSCGRRPRVGGREARTLFHSCGGRHR